MQIVRFVPVLLLLASTAVAARPESYTIELKRTVGLRVKVKEQRTSSLKVHYKDRGTASGSVEQKTLVQEYTQEVRKAQPEILVRDYAHSQRTKRGKGAPDSQELTSVHGRRVLVVGLVQHADGGKFKISKRDQEALRFDRLAESLVPPQTVVKLRESWSIAGKPLAASLWGEGFARDGRGCNAKVTLIKVKQVKGRAVATLKAKIRIAIPRVEKLPSVNMDLKGELKWDLEEQVLLEASFQGQLVYAVKNTELGKEAEWTARGPVRWSYAAELLASRAPRDQLARKRGEPPPPGTQLMICSLEPKHRVELKHYPNCLTCGKKYDKNFKCGATDHGWVWQYCPHDGAPLKARMTGE